MKEGYMKKVNSYHNRDIPEKRKENTKKKAKGISERKIKKPKRDLWGIEYVASIIEETEIH